MKQIGLEHRPDFAAVIDGRADIVAALEQAREALAYPDNQAAVVVRESLSLTETHRIAAAGLEWRSSKPYAYDGQGQFVTLGEDMRRRSYNAAAIDDVIGRDLRIFLQSVSQVFPVLRQMELRANDFTNTRPHLDFAAVFAGVAATMAVKGGGTILMSVTPDMLVRQREPRTGHVVWRLHCDVVINESNGWSVADGDICLTRSSTWPETHLPGLHCSPLRRTPGNPQERIVGVMLP